jgi:creatinine amidohydrolase
VNIADASWVDVEQRARDHPCALIPVGAVEVYGPHLPQGTDGIVAAAVCERAARRAGCLVAPLVPVGWSESLASFPGTLSVRPDALRDYCDGVVSSLFRWGIRSIMFVNGHLGNVPALQELALAYDRPDEGRRVAQIDLWRFIQPFTADLLRSPSWKYGHAGETMTAVMLYLRPDLVRMDRAGRFLPDDAGAPLGVHAPRRYRDQAPDGFVGDATLGTAEVGREIVDRCVERLVALLAREFGGASRS